MKYELIQAGDYLVAVSKDKIQINDIVCEENTDGTYSLHQIDTLNDIDNHSQNKVIAHLPPTFSSRIIGIDLLPPIEQEDDDAEKLAEEFYPLNDDLYPNSSLIRKGVIFGYNKARDKYRFTEEDMIKALSESFKSSQEGYQITTDEILQSLSQQKNMPVEFECVIEKVYRLNDDGEQIGYKVHDSNIIKKSTNAQGQTMWVGKYIY
jgi:hypothetical protein